MCGDSLCLRIQGDVARGFMGRDRVYGERRRRDSERLRAISERDWIVAPLLQSAPLSSVITLRQSAWFEP